MLYRERATAEYLEAIEPIGTDSLKPHLTDAPYLIAVFEQAWSLDADGGMRKHYYDATVPALTKKEFSDVVSFV